MKDYKLMNHPYCFAHVQIELSNTECNIALISYETAVCGIHLSEEQSFIWCKGNYSRSTIKHIGYFTSSFIGNNLYYAIKCALVKAKRDNNNGACYEYATVNLDERDVKIICNRVESYRANGERFTKYSKEPNYDMLYYGYSEFNPIILP